MKRKTKQNALLIFIASLPLLGAFYYIGNLNENKVIATVNETPKISLTSSNTPSQADDMVHWYSENIYATHRYTEFHYRYVIKDNTSHIVLANYGNGGLIENTQPLIYTYTLTFKASASSWSRIELKTSTDQINYETEESFVLNGNSKLTTLTTAKPYFTIQKVDGAPVNLNYLEVYYSC